MTSAAMPKHKCKFTDKLKKKNPCFRLGHDASLAECMTCRAGTYVSVANKGGSDLEAHVHSAKHKTAARGESSSSKVTDFFVSNTHPLLICTCHSGDCTVSPSADAEMNSQKENCFTFCLIHRNC